MKLTLSDGAGEAEEANQALDAVSVGRHLKLTHQVETQENTQNQGAYSGKNINPGEEEGDNKANEPNQQKWYNDSLEGCISSLLRHYQSMK